MYVPHAQLPREIGSAPRGMALVVKTNGDPLALAGRVREAVRALDRNLPVSDVRPLQDVAADALAQPRFTTWLLGVFRPWPWRWPRWGFTAPCRWSCPSAPRRWASAWHWARIVEPSSGW